MPAEGYSIDINFYDSLSVKAMIFTLLPASLLRFRGFLICKLHISTFSIFFKFYELFLDEDELKFSNIEQTTLLEICETILLASTIQINGITLIVTRSRTVLISLDNCMWHEYEYYERSLVCLTLKGLSDYCTTMHKVFTIRKQ